MCNLLHLLQKWNYWAKMQKTLHIVQILVKKAACVEAWKGTWQGLVVCIANWKEVKHFNPLPINQE
jgi:hypothetical protein